MRIDSFGPTSSVGLLPQILEEYHKTYPGIDIYVDEGTDEEVVQWIQEYRIDIGLVLLPDDRFETYAITEDQIVVVLPEQSPLAHKAQINLSDLCNDPFILTEAGSGPLVQSLFSEKVLYLKNRYRTSQVLRILSMVSRGEGIAMLAELALPPDNQRSGYIVRKLSPTIVRSIGVATNKTGHTSPALKAFLRIIKKMGARKILV